jgi:myosin-5
MKARHVQAKPYTRTGDIVIAVNPYQWLTEIYTEKKQLLYADKLVWKSAQGDKRAELEPHVYETSALSYKGLAVDEMNQSILVSGESGAGKTETVKICMNHMASLQKGPGGSKGGETNEVVQRVVDSNPLLEAFGNAKTRRNDNSSRFGKYILLQFDRQETVGGKIPICNLAGSKCEVYLLEKSRITTHDESERTYHIFYQIIGAKEVDKVQIWSGLKGTKNTSFKYIGYTDFTSYEGKEDGDHYYSTCEALNLVGVNGDKLMTLMRAITAVLQIGQLTFGPAKGDSEVSGCTSPKELEGLSEIVGIPSKDLVLALTERTMSTRGEVFKVPLKPDMAKDNADAYAKEIYSKVFLWLVREVNGATCAEDNYNGGRSSGFGTIGLLDIFGFESFPVNGFEQLCINYANEKLQQKFTRDIFQTVQEEYKFEGIALDDITYDDNTDVLDLIEGRTGLLAMLNEECMRPKGSDKEFVYKAIQSNKNSPCLIADKLLGPLDFGIHHYAGKVVYFAQGFLARNQDTLGDDLIQISKKSTNDIIANHLQNEKMMNNQEEPAAAASAAPRRGKSNIASDTLWTKFRTQLNSLMKNLNETQSRYIRCIKPNTMKKPLVMQHMTTIEQLRCAGVVAAITISRSAFPNRLDHRACYERFKVLKKKEKGRRQKKEKIDHKEEITKMLEKILAPLEVDGKQAFVMGKTRVYFRSGALEYLETERMKGFDQWAVDLQRVTRGWLVRKKNGGRKMQSKSPHAVRIQCAWRCFAAKRDMKKLKKVNKGKKKKHKKQLKAALKIQAIARGYLVRPKFRAKLKEKREKDGLKNKIKALEQKVLEAETQRTKEVEAARIAAEEEMEKYRKKVKEELANDKEKQKKNAQQQSLIEESGKIIEYLRKENMKLRTQNETMRKDFKALKENNQRLMEANASAGQSFTALNDHAKQLNATNAKLIKNVDGYKKQLEKLKEDLKTRQTYYLAEAEARLAYQKTMAQIVGAVQDKSRDAQLVEDVVIMALECEAEAKSERAALEAAAKKAKASSEAPPSSKAPAKSKSSSSTPSVARTEVSAGSDSDSDED